MDIKPEQVLSKTLKGISAARGGGAVTSKQRGLLKLVDSAEKVSAVAAGVKSMSAANASAKLAELHASGLVRVVEHAALAHSKSRDMVQAPT